MSLPLILKAPPVTTQSLQFAVLPYQRASCLLKFVQTFLLPPDFLLHSHLPSSPLSFPFASPYFISSISALRAAYSISLLSLFKPIFSISSSQTEIFSSTLLFLLFRFVPSNFSFRFHLFWYSSSTRLSAFPSLLSAFELP